MTKQSDSLQSSPPDDRTAGNKPTPVATSLSGKQQEEPNSRNCWISMTAIAVMAIGLAIDNFWMGFSGAIVALLASLRVILPLLQALIDKVMQPQQRSQFVALISLLLATLGLLDLIGFYQRLSIWGKRVDWQASEAIAGWVGALGEIFIAILAVYIAWQQYVISRDLTLEQNRLTNQQNIITQQQTIDTYFQGISELALDDEGFLEDWPQEQAFAEARTAALLGSIDAGGKAKVLRFLSQSKLLTPLRRDRRLGRPILNGDGGYEEDRPYGIRVIDLGVMLAGADLSGSDLRWTDLSEANLVKTNLSGCDLVKANLARSILYEANLVGADLKAVRLFYGPVETASPRSRTEPPDYLSGAHTGAVVQNVDFTDVQNLSEEQRQYCCAWGGEKTRATIPGGCQDIPNQLGR